MTPNSKTGQLLLRGSRRSASLQPTTQNSPSLFPTDSEGRPLRGSRSASLQPITQDSLLERQVFQNAEREGGRSSSTAADELLLKPGHLEAATAVVETVSNNRRPKLSRTRMLCPSFSNRINPTTDDIPPRSNTE